MRGEGEVESTSHCPQSLYYGAFPTFGVRGGAKSFILVEKRRVTQKVYFLFCFVLAYSYLCNQVSAQGLRGGAGMTFEENINKRLLLFGLL